jgi:hypothetical protein
MLVVLRNASSAPGYMPITSAIVGKVLNDEAVKEG